MPDLNNEALFLETRKREVSAETAAFSESLAELSALLERELRRARNASLDLFPSGELLAELSRRDRIARQKEI